MTSWREMAQDAESLMDSANLTPARIRTVISRSYYAAFHACLEQAKHAGYTWQRNVGGTHEQLLRFMTSKPGSRAYSVGKQLKRLRDRRVNADYHPGIRVARQDAEDALDIMSEIIADIPSESV